MNDISKFDLRGLDTVCLHVLLICLQILLGLRLSYRQEQNRVVNLLFEDELATLSFRNMENHLGKSVSMLMFMQSEDKDGIHLNDLDNDEGVVLIQVKRIYSQ